MATKMTVADLELVEDGTPNSQAVAVMHAPHQIEMARARIPEPSNDEIRIKIKWVGICGSDLETYRGTRDAEFVSVPTRLGHEVSGVIDQVGKNVRTLKVGDRVSCRYVWGAFAEYIVCKPFNVKVVPEWFPDEQISALEVLPGILHAAELAQIDASKNVLIMGQGVSGLVMTQVVSLFSPKNLVVTDLYGKNLALGKKYGADYAFQIPNENHPTRNLTQSDFPDGFDVVIPCLLEGDGMVDALDICAFGGRIVMYGCIGTCHKPFDFFRMHRKRIDIFSTEPKSNIDMRRWFEEGLQLMKDGLVNTAEMVTHRFPLSQIGEAFELRNDKTQEGTIHILIDCQS